MPAEDSIKLYDDIDSHVEWIVEKERELDLEDKSHKSASQRERNRLAREKALHIRAKKLEYIQDYGARSPKLRPAFLEWCKEVADLKGKTSADEYVRAGELLGRSKFLGGADMGVKSICAIESKNLNTKEMTALQQFIITQDKPLSEQKIHVWAHEQCGRDIPPKAAKKREEDIFLSRPLKANTMAGRLELKYTGRALLGIHLTTPPDVVDIVCKVWAQRYHPDKRPAGMSEEDAAKIIHAISEVKSQ